MKIFNKFANKNAGKPGLTRLWGGGARYLLALLLLCSVSGSCSASDVFLPSFTSEAGGLARDSDYYRDGALAARRGDPGALRVQILCSVSPWIGFDAMWLPGDVDCYVLGDLYQDYDTPLSLAEVLTVTRTVLKENGLLGTWTLGYLYFSGEAGSGQWSNYLYDAEFGNMEFRSGYWETFAKMRGGWRTIFSPKLPITDSSCKMRFVLTLGGLCLFGAGYCLQLLKNPLSMSSILRVKGL